MMHTRYFDLRDTKGQQKIIEDQISAAADILRQGGLVGIPTETVYGLGANALDAEAVNKKLFKGRPQTKIPLIIHIPGPQWLPRYCEDVPPLAYTLARKFWPGPLTMILKRKPIVPDATTAGLEVLKKVVGVFVLTLAIRGTALYFVQLRIAKVNTKTPTTFFSTSSPAVVASGTMGFRFRIMVRGPGQNFRASVYASGGTSSQYRGSHWASRTYG